MDKFIVHGGNKLFGKVKIQSAKNSALPLIAASVIAEGKTVIENCSKIRDVLIMCEIIRSIGGKAEFVGDRLFLDTTDVNSWRLPSSLTGEIRASLFMVGALICRFGYASIERPGGCKIGERPIDIHVDALRSLGVKVDEGEEIIFSGKNVNSGLITLRFPSVGATENAMMTALKGKGVTTIKNCAKEPEIVDLQNYLNLLGAKVKGAGSSIITVEGFNKKPSGEISFEPSPDRIELGTYLFALGAVGGELEIETKSFKNLDIVLKIFKDNACKIHIINDKIYNISISGRMRSFGKITTGPYPEFPTDLQPQLVACACSAKGVTAVEEKVFEKRFGYAQELKKFGANVDVYQNLCLVSQSVLHGANVVAGDLRGGASLLICALSAEGRSEISNAVHVDRGYYKIEEKLSALGAYVKRASY
ncbi:MAG: UDP-N-acetylglucosamine 1-carboxyvinyltransferase [Clostridia bacterium]|nr:UDP-N-acetylglucosamine 1-carboxyvinyltransferase [Clostridia bacterium]